MELFNFCSISVQIRSLAWDNDGEVWTSTLSSIQITLGMFVNVLNMHQTSSLSVIGHDVYSTCPFISCIGQWYQIEVIADDISTFVIDDCITPVM